MIFNRNEVIFILLIGLLVPRSSYSVEGIDDDILPHIGGGDNANQTNRTKMLVCTVNLTMPRDNKEIKKRISHKNKEDETDEIVPNEPVASQTSRPNILFVISDQQRFDFDGLHKNIELEMPNFKRLADEGVRFTSVFTASPLCGPSRTCLAVGRQYHEVTSQMKDFNSGPPAKLTTFYTALRDAGYHTMTCGKDDLRKGQAQLGLGPKWDLESFRSLGFVDGERSLGKKNVYSGKGQVAVDQYGDFLKQFGSKGEYKGGARYDSGFNMSSEYPLLHLVKQHETPGHGPGSTATTSIKVKHEDGFVSMSGSYKKCMHAKCPVAMWMPDEVQEDGFVGRKAIQLLRRRPKEKPFFLQVNFPSPHDPYTISSCMSKAIKDRNIGEKASEGRRSYAALCEIVDVWLGKIVEEVEGEGVLGNTVVCFTSDHGDLLGDGGDWGKQKPGQGSVAVPMVCRGPHFKSKHRTFQHWQKMMRGAVVTQPVMMQDLAATFLDIASVKKPPSMTAQSLLPVLIGARTPFEIRPVITTGLGSWKAVISTIEVPANSTITSVTSRVRHLASRAIHYIDEDVSGDSHAFALLDERRWVNIRVNMATVKNIPQLNKWKVIDPETNYVVDITASAFKANDEQLIHNRVVNAYSGVVPKDKSKYEMTIDMVHSESSESSESSLSEEVAKPALKKAGPGPGRKPGKKGKGRGNSKTNV